MFFFKLISYIFRWLLGPLLTLSVLGLIVIVVAWSYYSTQLPSKEVLLNNVSLQLPLRIYSKEKKLIAEFGQFRRRPEKIEDIPANMINAFVSIEDSRFYEHKGVDFYGVARAVVKALKTRNVSEGASTITMQVARNYFLSRRKKLDRKLKEILLAGKLEEIYTKDQILELYLNKIFLGKRSYGVGSAAEVYYGKKIQELTLAQNAMIAGLPKAPALYNPIKNPKRAKIRRDYILLRMFQLKKITDADYQQALAEPITAKVHSRAKTETKAPYVAEMVRTAMVKRFGEALVYERGMKVYTTIDSNEQEHAIKTMRKHLISYHKRHGYTGPEAHIQLSDYYNRPEALLKYLNKYSEIAGLIPAVVMSTSKAKATLKTRDNVTVTLTLKQIKWARKHISENRRGKKVKSVSNVLKMGDIVRVNKNDKGEWSLTPLPSVAGALVSMNPVDGAVNAVVGGFDYRQSRFNRATQAKRQPGSSFKPFVYASALAKNYSPASVVNDSPIRISGSKWRPQNYSGKSFGPTRLRYGLKKSRNLVSIQLLREIGIDYARTYVEKFGFNRSEVPPNLTMALGTGSVTPMQMAGTYSTFANGGYKVEPYFISHIDDHLNNSIWRHFPNTVCKHCDSKSKKNMAKPRPVNIAKRIMKPHVNYQINSMLQSVATSGTAVRTRVLKRNDIGGKTGTTNDQKDAWFSGFTPQKVTTVWMGFDQIKPMGRRETATGLALPTWIDFMKVALKDIPQARLKPPKGMRSLTMDALTGFIADKRSKETVSEMLVKAQIPGMLPPNFLYNGNILQVNNPNKPTITLTNDYLIDHNMSILDTNLEDINATLPENAPQAQTRTIDIDGQAFEIPEQLF
ncbi:MAG: penicillin-binding protein 1A [Thiotrichaceae bacterium]|nr:penicillin-binding protein 1A [Thiotrichaceae bacterium]